MKYHLNFNQFTYKITESKSDEIIKELYYKIKRLKAKRKELCDVKIKRKLDLQIKICEFEIEIARLGI